MQIQLILPALLAAMLLPAVCWSADDVDIAVSTHTYKKVGDLEIKLDLHRPADDKIRPVLVWIHGGALINGHRASVPGRLSKPLLEAGCAIVSIDYRLAPETQLPEIIADLEDAFTWIHKHGREVLHVDPDRLVVAGGSAGGYLTLTAGYRAKPRPRALVSFWGYGDLVGDWYSKPSPHARHSSDLSRDEAYRQVSGPPVSDSRERKGDGGAFYRYCRKQGIWPKAVSGWDPQEEAEKFAPYMPLKNVTADYPPTLMIHGTKDTDVPYENSTLMAEQFNRHGVKHELLTIDGGEHGLGGGDPEKINQAYNSAIAFIKRRLGLDY
ncbi:MAG: alpha/beta hydrolase [Pirellulaceae bacterium]